MTADAPQERERAPEPEATPPVLRVVTPDATDEEVAALVAVFSAMGGGAPGPKPRRSLWSAPYRQVRINYSHGPGSWRASGLPQHRGR